MSLLFLIINLLALALFARWFVGLGIGAPFVPLPMIQVANGINLAAVSNQDCVVDLGSGDGRILLAAAKRGARVIGYELNPFLVVWSRWRLRPYGDRAKIYRANLLTADVSAATIVFVFQMGHVMPKLLPMLRRKQPLKVVSFAFDLPGETIIAQQGVAKLYEFGRM